MILLSLYGAEVTDSLEHVKYIPESTTNYELVPNINQQIRNLKYISWIDHDKEFCSQEICTPPGPSIFERIQG
jgi:hypothetical protein